MYCIQSHQHFIAGIHFYLSELQHLKVVFFVRVCIALLLSSSFYEEATVARYSEIQENES